MEAGRVAIKRRNRCFRPVRAGILTESVRGVAPVRGERAGEFHPRLPY